MVCKSMENCVYLKKNWKTWEAWLQILPTSNFTLMIYPNSDKIQQENWTFKIVKHISQN